MRLFEIVFAALVVGFSVTPRRWTGLRTFFGVLLLPAGVLHVIVEGWRWQMVPLYLVGAIVLGVALWEMFSPASEADPPGRWTKTAAAVGLVFVVALPAVVPVWELPEPTGDFEVGTITLTLTDIDRSDPYDPQMAPRRLNVQFWYPAEPPPGAEPEPWLAEADAVGSEIAAAFGFPRFALSHSNLILSHSFSQAAVAAGNLPVVIYSHGWTGLRSAGLDQIEELASHGFVVVAADHTFGAAATAFGPDEVVAYEPTALPEFGTVPDDEYDAAALQLVATYAEDLRFIMDELERLNDDPGWILSGNLDLSRIGLFGHSTGGGAVVSACARDERCRAAVGFDPWVEPVPADVLEEGLATRFLAIRSEEWLAYDNDPVLRRLASRSPATDLLGLYGAGHQDFTVLPRFARLSVLLGAKGSISSDRAAEIINTYLVAFFDAELNGGPGLEPNPPFEEVCFGPC